MSIAIVWLKRDLRLSDHLPLKWASSTGLPVLMIYNFEPMLLQDNHYSKRHWQFVTQSLLDIQSRLPRASLLCASEDMLALLSRLHEKYNVRFLFSHQEVGLSNTFQRDKDVLTWCYNNEVLWHEAHYAAVIRGKPDRIGWDKHWSKVMRTGVENVDPNTVNWMTTDESDLASTIQLLDHFNVGETNWQQGGETEAWRVLDSFFATRGKSYAFTLSSPEHSQVHCSRLSAYLAWGNLSLRQVYQSLLSHWKKPGWRRSLSAFSSRLHWHCHFIQKFESESDMEFRAVNKGYENMPRMVGELSSTRLTAWKSGNTGIPMVDACMRCLLVTGYLNFRMRAMLVSFLCHHLEVDWRFGVKHLASVFLDFEPGIHYSQFQMQAGITGVNTIRIYNPVKQGQEKDPNGYFVKRWLPELSEIPETFVHQPWKLTAMEQAMYAIELGVDYPLPIVDLEESYKKAQQLLWSWKTKPEVVQEKQRILRRHVRQE